MKESEFNVFLSYSHEDLGMAKRIYNDLSSHGISVWFDQASLAPGQNWEYEIEKAIEKSRFFIMLLSRNSVSKKGYVQKEAKKAISIIDLFPEDEVFVIPVRLEECEVRSSSLRKRQWVDLFPDEQYLNGIKKIAFSIKPDVCILRSTPSNLDEADVLEALISHGFYERIRNPKAVGANVQLEKAVTGHAVTWIDRAHSIMWNDDVIWLQEFNTRGGPGSINDALRKIEAINDQGYASFHDWRVPTLEEAGTLLSPSESYWKQAYVTCDHYRKISNHNDYMWVVDTDKQEVYPRISSYFHAECLRLVRNLYQA